MIMDADKTQDLQGEWENWRSKKANGLFLVGVWAPENQESLWCKFLHTGQQAYDPGRADVSIWVQKQNNMLMAQFKASQEEFCSQSFCSIQVSNWLDETHPH